MYTCITATIRKQQVLVDVTRLQRCRAEFYPDSRHWKHSCWHAS